MITPVTDHVQIAIGKLMSQYADSQKLIDLITALIGPVQTIEDTLTSLNTDRALAVAVGVNLDNLGTVIGQARFPGDDDDTYRRKLQAQIKINTSQGQPEQAIQMYQLFTNSPLVLLTEFFPAEIIVSSTYYPPTTDIADLLIDLLQKVVPAGVLVGGIISFSPTAAFAYDGVLPGAGYSSVSNPSSGGGYATIHRRSP